MNELTKAKKYDMLGVLSAIICILHCALTPLILSLHPVLLAWGSGWEYFEYAFLGLSFIAVYFSSYHSLSNLITSFLWVLYSVFMVSVIFEEDYPVLEYTAYLSSAGLALSHLLNIRYNKKYLKKA